MDKININSYKIIEDFLKTNQNNINSSTTKLCTFIYGENGVGKTSLINKILKNLDYNVNEFNIFSQKNKSIVEFYQEYGKYTKNIMDIFYNKIKNNVILIDNIDLINSIDKNTITSLIKLLRPKKNKKDNDSNISRCQIIIIGTNDNDKKIKELMKICNTIKINTPSREDIYKLLVETYRNVDKKVIDKFLLINKNINYYLIDKFKNFINSGTIDKFIKYSTDNITNNNVKFINYSILKDPLDFNDDNNKINDTDKTTVSLLFHENIVDYINNDVKTNINLYKKILENYCFGDYMDRIIFQKQLWQLNEISFKIKVIYNNTIFHDFVSRYNQKNNIKLNNIRFTKILTKYSSEFNNYTFIINMCQSIDIDKKDLFLLFYLIKNNYDIDFINYLTNKYNITSLDINRLIKFISIVSIYEL